MGPVGQIVKLLFYMILGTELVFSVAIYAMATILLCSKIFIPEHILLHGSIALFLSIVTLSIIHKGFQAVAHDCPFHLYCFAVILVVLLLIQFFVEMFGIRATSRNVWYQQQSLPVNHLSSRKLDLEDNVEYIPVESLDKLAYRVPTREELEARKNQLYEDSEKRHKSWWNHGNKATSDEETEMHPARKEPSHRRKIGSRRNADDGGHTDEGKKDQEVSTEKTKFQINKTEEKSINTPLVLVFHGYSFILKMVCVALSILTGFMYQLEYV